MMFPASTSTSSHDDGNNNNYNSSLRRRSSSAATINNGNPPLPHSFSESSFSRVTMTMPTTTTTTTITPSVFGTNDDTTSSFSLLSSLEGGKRCDINDGKTTTTTTTTAQQQQLHPSHHHTTSTTTTSTTNSFSVKGILSSTFFLKRFSTKSSLSWGHKPSPYIGASCLCYLFPIPFFVRACAYHSATMLLLVTFSSYMSDHVYTGIESYAHALDRLLAPMAFASCLFSTYIDCGWIWASTSLLAVKCHALANYYARRGMYEQFVLWHCLWHVVGVGLIVLCYWWNEVVGSCWKTNNEKEYGELFCDTSQSWLCQLMGMGHYRTV